MKKWIKNQIAWFKIVVLQKYDGLIKKKWSTGNGHTSYGTGFEIINPKTNKVIYRKGKNTTNLDDSRCDWDDIDIFFFNNL